MTAFVELYLPWFLSAVTIIMTWMAGSNHRMTWSVGVFNQALWLAWILTTHTWGFLPMNLVLTVVMTRNHIQWSRNADKAPTLD